MQTRPDDAARGGRVELLGYRVAASLPFVLVTGAVTLWTMLWLLPRIGLGSMRLAALIAAAVMLGVFALFTYRLVLALGPEGLAVTRRSLIGSRSWRIPLAELESWSYAESVQTLVLRRRGERPLRFVLWMGKNPRKLRAWAGAALARYADEVAGDALSRRARRILVTSFLSAGAATMIALVVILLTIG